MADQPKSFNLTPEIHAYLVAHGTPPDDVQQALIERTSELGGISMMQIAPEQGAFMTQLAALVAPRFAVEVGTFTGYSSLCIARGLASDGRLLCCDVSDEYTAVARRYWARAGVADRIGLRVAPAIETLRALPPDPAIDLVFLDADKGGYVDYWEELVPRMRTGGVLLVDNVLSGGRVVDEGSDSETVAHIRRFNDHAAADERVEVAMLPIADGVTMARRL